MSTSENTRFAAPVRPQPTPHPITRDPSARIRKLPIARLETVPWACQTIDAVPVVTS